MMNREQIMAMEPARHANDPVRLEALLRLGLRCQYCWHTFPHSLYLECEHIVSKHLGGEYTPDNITLACKPCNGHKGKKGTPDQVRGRNVLLGLAAQGYPAEWDALVGLSRTDRPSPAHFKLMGLLTAGVDQKCMSCGWKPESPYQLTIYDEGKGHESWKGPTGNGVVLCHHCRSERVVWGRKTLEDMQAEIHPLRKQAEAFRIFNSVTPEEIEALKKLG